MNPPAHDVVHGPAMTTRYRQRRLILLVTLLGATVIPIIAVGAWWLWPLLVIPAVLAAPLAGGIGLIATLLAAAVALATASAGQVSAGEITAGFVAVVVLAALGAAHAGMAEGLAFGQRDADDDRGRRPSGLAPLDVFDLIADRDCQRAAEDGGPVSLALVGITDLDDITTIYGGAVRDALLDAANHGVARVISPSDLVVDIGDGRFMALVSGPAERAREAGDRIAIAIEAVHVRGGGGVRVSAGAIAAGVAQWIDGDQGMEGMLTRAESALIPVPRTPVGITDTAVTGEFRSVAVADAA